MRPARCKVMCAVASRSAFTLMELMVVIVILGVLATLVMPRILDRPDQARQVKGRAQIRSFQNALMLFKMDTGRYPTSSEGLNALVSSPGLKGWQTGGYLEDAKVPMDPWGKPYVYSCPGQGGRDFDIVSYGKDGQPGGTDYAADIESWNLEGE